MAGRVVRTGSGRWVLWRLRTSRATECPFWDGDFSFASATATHGGYRAGRAGGPGASWPAQLSPTCLFGAGRVLGAELCFCSQSQQHLSCLCFSHCRFLGSTGVRNLSSTRSLSPVWERDLFRLEKTLPCHRSSVEALASACDTHPRRLTSHLRPAPSAAAAGPGFCHAASADPRGMHGPVIHTTSQNNVATRKQAQLLLLGLLPFVLGFCFPGHSADGFCPVPVPVSARISPTDSGVRCC